MNKISPLGRIWADSLRVKFEVLMAVTMNIAVFLGRSTVEPAAS